MLSLPDFKEKQLLFIQAAQAADNKLCIKNDNLCFVQDGGVANQISCQKVSAVFIIGDFSITTVFIRNCAKYGVALFLLRDNLDCYAELPAVAAGNYLLRMKQYRIANELDLAKWVVKNKVLNQLRLLYPSVKEKEDFRLDIEKKIMNSGTDKELLGIEGNSTKAFFAVYFADVGWRRRAPRSKEDVINLLLDIGYTMLFNYITALLALYGFDPYKGFYHKLFFERKSLSCDIMESFRCLIERQLLKSYHLKQINMADFEFYKGKYQLSYDKQKKYLAIFSGAIMERKEEIFCFVRDFYYFLINETGELPVFKI